MPGAPLAEKQRPAGLRTLGEMHEQTERREDEHDHGQRDGDVDRAL